MGIVAASAMNWYSLCESNLHPPKWRESVIVSNARVVIVFFFLLLLTIAGIKSSSCRATVEIWRNGNELNKCLLTVWTVCHAFSWRAQRICWYLAAAASPPSSNINETLNYIQSAESTEKTYWTVPFCSVLPNRIEPPSQEAKNRTIAVVDAWKSGNVICEKCHINTWCYWAMSESYRQNMWNKGTMYRCRWLWSIRTHIRCALCLAQNEFYDAETFFFLVFAKDQRWHLKKLISSASVSVTSVWQRRNIEQFD